MSHYESTSTTVSHRFPRVHLATKKLCWWYLKRNRLIDICCIITLIPRWLPGQFVISSLLTAGNSVGCHGSDQPLLLLSLLQRLNEAWGDIGGLPLCDWLCWRLPRTTASGGIPLLRGRSQCGRLRLQEQCHLLLLVGTDTHSRLSFTTAFSLNDQLTMWV